MASGRFNLTEPYDNKSPNCVEAYVDWSSTLNYGTTHTVTMSLYARRKDYTGSTNIQYGAPSWTRTYTNSRLVFSGGSFVHICTVQTTVSSDTSGVAYFGATFYAGFYSSSYGTRRMSGTIYSLQLDRPKVSVSIRNSYSDGISCTVNNSSPTVGSQITFTVAITNGTKYSGYNLSVSGATLVSGTTYKVTGNVTATITGTIRSYTLSISQTAGISVTVKSGSTTYSNGSSIPYGTSLSISVSLNNGYDFVSFTVNGNSYAVTTTVSASVSGNITVVASARQSGVVYIRDSTGAYNKYQVYICTSQYGWALYKPMLYSGGTWNTCS